MAKKHFELTINTKPYLKKYLETLYGSPLVFTTENYFGITIAAFLFRPLRFHHRKELLRLRTDKFESKMQIHIPATTWTDRRDGFCINDEHVICINKLFEKRFEEDLWKFCLLRNIKDIETKDALLEFCALYNITIDCHDEDISFEALKKKEWRFRKKMKDSAPQLSRQEFDDLVISED